MSGTCRYNHPEGVSVFNDMSAPCAVEFLDDFFVSEDGGEVIMFDNLLVGPSGRVDVEEPHGFPKYPFLEVHHGDRVIIDLTTSTSPPGTPVQPPPPVVSLSSPCSPPNSSTGAKEPKSNVEIEVLQPSAGDLQQYMSRRCWLAEVTSMLPDDILRKAPRKRGEGKFFVSGQKYKPCSNWNEFIERVNWKINAGKYKAIAKRPRRQRQLRDLDETKDPVVVALQAQAEIYGDDFNGAATFFDWD